MLKSEIIHFFSTEQFFRQKTAETRKAKFESLKTTFYQASNRTTNTIIRERKHLFRKSKFIYLPTEVFTDQDRLFM